MDVLAELTQELNELKNAEGIVIRNHDGSKVRKNQVEAAVNLIDEGNTIPFIARYRKEATGELGDEQLRFLSERLVYLRSLEEKKAQILNTIEEQGALTKELREDIEQARTMVALEDLYRPYRPRRKTRADAAKQKGLQPFADAILAGKVSHPLLEEAKKYVTDPAKCSDPDFPAEKIVAGEKEALQGAKDILAETISDDASVRTWIREKTWKEGTLCTKEKKEKEKETSGTGSTAAAKAALKMEDRRSVYEMYFDFEERICALKGHQVLAITRGENEKFLSVKVNAPTEEILSHMRAWFAGKEETKEEKTPVKGKDTKGSNKRSGSDRNEGYNERRNLGRIVVPQNWQDRGEKSAQGKSEKGTSKNAHRAVRNVYTAPVLEEVAQDAYDRLIAPAIEREIRSLLFDSAQDGAIVVFRKNLEELLMQPPIAGQVVLGWDPGYRTGCKIAVVDETGKVLDTTVVYPTAPFKKVDETKKVIKRLIEKDHVSLISLGNGTASRESEQVIAEIIAELRAEHKNEKPVQYIIVNEAGASVYSASKLATEEFPKFDVGQRSAASMARRLQDPLSELVKIDPKALGVGQYQHDMNQKKLGEALGGVVEDCVNRVGVDLNTASFSLLSYISGISSSVAKNIVVYREEKGRFESRKDLLKVPKLGPKAYEQCAGFLRISGGKEPLDGTAVHPENYAAVRELLKKLGLQDTKESFASARAAVKGLDRKVLAEELGIGEITLDDILKELEKPARDPREDMPAPILRQDVLSLEDLKPGMKLKGTVRNIVDFGAFVDIGVHQDGLVHISRLTDRYVKHPLEVVHVGDIVDVTVVSADPGKKRIALSMNGKM